VYARAEADKPKGRYDSGDEEEKKEDGEKDDEARWRSGRIERTRVLLRGYTNIARPRVNCRPLESYKCTACRIYFVGAHIS